MYNTEFKLQYKRNFELFVICAKLISVYKHNQSYGVTCFCIPFFTFGEKSYLLFFFTIFYLKDMTNFSHYALSKEIKENKLQIRFRPHGQENCMPKFHKQFFIIFTPFTRFSYNIFIKKDTWKSNRLKAKSLN